MKNLTDDEKKKLISDIIKSWDDGLVDALKNGNWGTSFISPSPLFRPGMSPTDIDAKGMYDYQVPEVDEQGTYYGYKVLNKCDDYDCGGFISPRYNVHWSQKGELRADRTPAENTMHGIHFTKRMNHPELSQYVDRYEFSRDYTLRHNQPVLVKCALSGTIVETEQGWRAEHALIVGVYINGNWQSYQDYQERSRTYPRPITRKEWEEEEGWKYNKPRYWDTSSDA